ncbi:MAG: type II toxin-antitoxin system HicB family antitoxin [Rhizobacter sp.]|nr:type II toxin-antitoxin system HicB family antitoxin [Burkholderiales bacterium]
MNVMTVDGYHAKIEFDPDLDLFRGEILGLNGGVDFCGKSPKELRAEFKRSLTVFLEVCAGRGIKPERHFSGKFNLRISPQLHEKLAIAAQAKALIFWRKRLYRTALRELDAS